MSNRLLLTKRYILIFMDFYVAKDSGRIGFFKDEPDLVKFSSSTPPVWEGYPMDFGDFSQIKTIVSQHPSVIEMDDYDPPIHFHIDNIVIKVL